MSSSMKAHVKQIHILTINKLKRDGASAIF